MKETEKFEKLLRKTMNQIMVVNDLHLSINGIDETSIKGYNIYILNPAEVYEYCFTKKEPEQIKTIIGNKNLIVDSVRFNFRNNEINVYTRREPWEEKNL